MVLFFLFLFIIFTVLLLSGETLYIKFLLFGEPLLLNRMRLFRRFSLRSKVFRAIIRFNFRKGSYMKKFMVG